MKAVKACKLCGNSYMGYTAAKDSICHSCYNKYYYKNHKAIRTEKTCSKCGQPFKPRKNNTTGLCGKCKIKEYQHKYYITVTKPGRLHMRNKLRTEDKELSQSVSILKF